MTSIPVLYPATCLISLLFCAMAAFLITDGIMDIRDGRILDGFASGIIGAILVAISINIIWLVFIKS